MTAAPSVAYPSMDLLHPEDTMDLASSPRIPADDLDLPYELETMRDASTEPTQEAMIEDPINPDQNSTEDLELVDEDLLDDDDMVDEDTVAHNADANNEDFTMESHQQTLPGAEHEDDDILYDDDEPVQEGNTEAQDIQDVEIADEEDLFREDEEKLEYSLEDTSLAPQMLHSNQDEEILDEEQSTNMITQDAKDLGATQGPLYSGDSTDNIREHNVEDQAKVEDIANHKPGHERSTDAIVAGGSMTNESATSPAERADDPQTSALLESPKSRPTSPSVADTVGRTSQVEASQLATHESEFAEAADGERPRHETGEETEHDEDHQTHSAMLHTVKVNYQDTEICLFPPNENDESETFFLADVGLAHQSLDRLLGACHDVLAGTIGDDDELVLDIPSLGLHVSQDSSYATQMSLSQVLDVYLALSHNKQTELVEPLYCHLSSRVSLASQYAYLLGAAEQGKTFAEIASEHLHPDEGDEVNDLIEGHEENRGVLGQDEVAENGDSEHKNGYLEHNNHDLEPTRLEAAQETPDSHAHEGVTTEDVLENEDSSNSNALDSIPQTDGDDVGGNVENETSATSTVRGDELEPQDFETSHELGESANVASIPADYEVAAEDEDGKAETQSAVEDTESSRTVEAGDDAFESAINPDAEGERGSFVDNDGYFHDNIEAEEPADTVEKLDVQEQAIPKSVQVGNLHRDDQDFRPTSQAAQDSAKGVFTIGADSEYDHDDFLDVHEDEDPEPLEQAAAHDHINGAAENEIAAQDDGHEDLLGLPPSNGAAQKADAEIDAVQYSADEDELLFGGDDAKAPMHEVTSPATPSNSKTSKRKTRDEEDDFDLLDSGTPDVKRRRPS